jgi:hypothetical protein
MVNYRQPDLSIHPPRSPRCRLGNFAHLPRLLDKARAHIAGRMGEYNWNCPLDKRFTSFTGVDIEALRAEVKLGRSDTEMLAWVTTHSQPARQPWEIAAWSDWLENLTPGDANRHTVFAEMLNQHSPMKDDLRTFFDRLEFDDFVSFGGQA